MRSILRNCFSSEAIFSNAHFSQYINQHDFLVQKCSIIHIMVLVKTGNHDMFSVWHCWLLLTHFYILAKRKIDSKLPEQRILRAPVKCKITILTERKRKWKFSSMKLRQYFLRLIWTQIRVWRDKKRIPQTRRMNWTNKRYTSYPKMGRKRTKEGNGCHIWLECFKGHGVWKFYANDLPRKLEKTISKQTICTFLEQNDDDWSLEKFEKMPKAQEIMDKYSLILNTSIEAGYIYKFVIKYPGLRKKNNWKKSNYQSFK